MPVKNGERVYYKIEDGTIKTGIYENPKGKGRGRVKLAGGKFAMPPKSALHHTRKGAMSEAFYDSSNKDPILGAKAGPAAAKEKAKAKNENEKEKATPKKTPTKGKGFIAGPKMPQRKSSTGGTGGADFTKEKQKTQAYYSKFYREKKTSQLKSALKNASGVEAKAIQIILTAREMMEKQGGGRVFD